MNKNEIVKVNITDLGTDGEGIGKTDGFILFVKGAVPGDEIEAHILKVKKNLGYAKIERILSPSPDRVEPKCTAANRCGGCQIQQLSYEKQLEIKKKKVFDCLTRIGGVDPETLEKCYEGIIGMEEPWHYRNKAQYPVGIDKDGNPRIGFYSYHSHNIIENDECEIEKPLCALILKELRAIISRFDIEPYNEELGRGVLRHCLIRTGFSTGEVMVCLVVNAKGKEMNNWKAGSEPMETLVKALKEAVDKSGFKFVSLCVNVNTKNTNVILGDKLYPVYGPTYINDMIGDVIFRISPLSFYQVNPVQTKKLYEKALEYAELTGNETVWDLYCGIGTISLFLAKKAKKVYGVEIVPEAVENAKENAKLNNISNAEFFCGAAEDAVPRLNRELTNAERCDVIVVDPPRKGCDEKLLHTMITMDPIRIIYVSCDPATLGRDVKFLTEHGYRLTGACAVDQFCHSMHVETVVSLIGPRGRG
ncbi:MAG: 23S rRNA (uracil(1939)-C(5))-methyltransferase RlmD [Lachnospiraceae bacterium]|nr:23S rRNA (uracil(1939)-C(5))-methyltransferase RlmD [Lachnospiraceae bacterium]